MFYDINDRDVGFVEDRRTRSPIKGKCQRHDDKVRPRNMLANIEKTKTNRVYCSVFGVGACCESFAKRKSRDLFFRNVVNTFRFCSLMSKVP